MLRRRWDYLNNLYRKLSVNPGEVPRRQSSKAIYRIIRENSFDRLDMTEDRAIQACGYVFSTFLTHDYNIITGEDIGNAVEQVPLNSSGRDKLLLENEVPSWFGHADLEEVNGVYCESDLSQFDEIYVAPIAPELEQIVSVLGEPAALTTETIQQVLLKAFTEHKHLSDRNWADRCPEVDAKDLDALTAWVKSEFDSDGWIQIEDESFECTVWVDPDRIEEKIRQNGPVYSEKRLVRTLIEEALKPLAGIPDSKTFLFTGYLKEMLKKLETRYEWKTITTADGVWWYASPHLHKAELLLYAQEHQRTIDNPDNATKEEIESALSFLEENDNSLIRIIDATREAIDDAVVQLDASLEKRRLYSSMQDAQLGESPSDVETKIELDEPPTLYDVAREFEEALRKKRREESDQDDEPEVYKP
jgi:hypothetical protein